MSRCSLRRRIPKLCTQLSSCWHTAFTSQFGFRRTQHKSRPTPFSFASIRNNFSIVNGQFDTVTRHFGGSTLSSRMGHADVARLARISAACGNVLGLSSAPLGDIPWDDAGRWRRARPTGNPFVKYHWCICGRRRDGSEGVPPASPRS